MDCQHAEQNDIVGKYLTGQLSAEQQQAFEEHFFGCARCFEELQASRATQAELAWNAAAIRAEPLSGRAGWTWAWALGLAAASVIAVIVWLRPPAPGPQAPPVVTTPPTKQIPPVPAAPSLAELARFDPPAYTPAVLRGPAGEATRKFRDAMQHYVKGDYRAAIPGLRAAVGLNPKAPDANFFLAICYLLTDQTDPAVAGLRKTIALGDTPYLEEAHFYLAKAHLGTGNLDSARGELEKTIQLGGELQRTAQALLTQMEVLRTGPR